MVAIGTFLLTDDAQYVDVDAGERVLQVGEGLASAWRAEPSASPELEGLAHAVGGVSRLRALLVVDPAAVEAVAASGTAARLTVTRVIERVGALLDESVR